jgi:exopolyphosphatase/guanosine-5'-triphosphate,3'-diphosphate pyrophosphatase
VTIVPRWEWRTFGDHFGQAEARFHVLIPDAIQESDETYILSRKSDASVKVRDGLMDVKHLQTVNDDGLEQWIPVLKAQFPLAADDVSTLYDALGAGHPPHGDEVSLEQLLTAVRNAADLRAIEVHKKRMRYEIDRCMAELSEISSDGHSTRTIAIELEDPEPVIGAARDLGLGDRANTCMAKGLKALVGFE